MRRLLNAVLAFALASGPVLAGVVYVDSTATGSADGSSWDDAFASLRTALTSSLPGDELWVARGDYHAPFSGKPATAFVINGRSLYGGFVGAESSREQRDWYVNKTTLHGDDLQGVVAVRDSAQAQAVLDGFVITGGNVLSPNEGGGAFVQREFGGVRVANCLITDNFAWRGGGIRVWGQVEVVNTIIAFNQAGGGEGGGVYCSGFGSPLFEGCIIYGSTTVGGNPSGVLVDPLGHPKFRNSIIWAPGSMSPTNSGEGQDVQFCCREGHGGQTNIFDDPRFVDPDNLDFRLRPGSRCVDAGSNDAVPADILLDHAGRRRFLDDPRKANTGQGIAPIVDIGPFELVPDCNQNGIPDDEELTALDLNGNTVLDVCERAGTAFCFGDDSGAACPCGNQSPAGSEAGCANVSGNGGRLEAFGLASVSSDTLVLHADGLPASAPALYFQGDSLDLVAGIWGAPFGNGLRCAYGAVIRLGGVVSMAGQSSLGAHPGSAFRLSVQGVVPRGGGTRYYQVWYRDGAAFCTGAGFSLTNAMEVQWAP